MTVRPMSQSARMAFAFGNAEIWTWDDGTDLGTYNTQPHWVTRNALYLVYTRKSANNDHIFRHRAPLFIAQIDAARLWFGARRNASSCRNAALHWGISA